MKTILTSMFAAAMLASPALAQTISDVDHPDVPNCTIKGPNPPNCENLTIQAIYAHNGLGTRHCYKNDLDVMICLYNW